MTREPFPEYYYGRTKESDRAFIEKCMFFIPEELKQQVADQYDAIYRNSERPNRKGANTFIHAEALKHKSRGTQIDETTNNA